MTTGTPAPRLVMLLDYDGTLVPFAPTPELAIPDAALVDLLRSLASLAQAEVHIVSGRSRETLEAWLGGLPVALHAEHGLWVRASPAAPWRARFRVDTAWFEEAARILGAEGAVPGTSVERKSASLAWHYRLAEPVEAGRALQRVRRALEPLAMRHGLELLGGACVVELRDVRANKGAVAAEVVAAAPGATVIAMGDDSTDEDMFATLPAEAITIHVGDQPTRARQHVADPAAARAWLAAFAAREAVGAAPMLSGGVR